MSETTDDMPDNELLAAEYALGVLAGAERAATAARIERDRAFASLVVDWEQRLAPWAGDIADIAPPAHVWEQIAARLPTGPQPGIGLWQNLVFWRGFALASALATACLGAFIYLGSITPSPLIAAIEGSGRPVFVATVDARRGTVSVVPASYSADATRVPELWLIPADGKPRPLGVISADRTVTIAIPAALSNLTTGNAVLAVSLEPPGGSPTGAPTGPVIGTGKLTNL